MQLASVRQAHIALTDKHDETAKVSGVGSRVGSRVGSFPLLTLLPATGPPQHAAGTDLGSRPPPPRRIPTVERPARRVSY